MDTSIQAISDLTPWYASIDRWCELVLTTLSIVAHFLDARANIWARILAFPVLGMNIYVYATHRFWGKVLHSIIGILANSYAYCTWRGSQKRPAVQFSKTPYPILISSIMGAMVVAAIWVVGRKAYDPSTLPWLSIYLDALYFFLGLIEKWLMAHKSLARWMFALIRYLALGLACHYAHLSPFLRIQQALLMCIAIYGQWRWHRLYKNDHRPNP